MRRYLRRKYWLFLTLAFALNAQQSWAQSKSNDTDFADFLDVNFYADGRLRYQTLDQENLPDISEALTLSVQTGLEFEVSNLFSALVEIEGNEQLIDDFNDSVNGNINAPTIIDVETIELNRLQLQTEFIPGTRLTVGRQRFALDNWRFLGRWEFRQNDQTFDALRAEVTLGKGQLNLGYFNKVHRHFGNDSPVGEFSGDSYIINYAHPLPLGQLSLFHYALDLETGLAANPIDTFSNQTTGIRWHGRRHWDKYGLAWDASFARQSDFADNPNSYEAFYRDIGLEFQYDRLKLDLGLEVLGSDDGIALQAPLGSLHSFQGVTDRFFTTPTDGIKDYHINFKTDFGTLGPIKRIRANIGYHNFTSDVSRRNYGEEFNLSLSGNISDLTLLFEFGDYKTKASADEVGLFTHDARSVIFSTSYSFD